MLKAIIDGTMPRLLFIDIEIFRHVTQDIFPDVAAPELSNKYKVKEVIEENIDKLNLCGIPQIIQNVLNDQEIVILRSSRMLLMIK